MTLKPAVSLFLVTLGLPLVAAAQPDPYAAGPLADLPEPVAMDRHSGPTAILVQLDSTRFSAEGDFGHEVLYGERLELFARLHDERSGFGADASISFSKAFANDESSDIAMSNLEVGASYSSRTPDLGLTAHLGVVAPVGSDDFSGFISNAVGGYGRLTDLVTDISQAYWFRPSVTVASRGRTFVRADLGLDLGIAENEDLAGDRETATIFRASVGFGIVGDQIAFLGEIASILNADDAVDSSALFQPMAGLRFLGPGLRPGFAIGTIIGDDVDAVDILNLQVSLAATL
jgi:hypothetical protein